MSMATGCLSSFDPQRYRNVYIIIVIVIIIIIIKREDDVQSSSVMLLLLLLLLRLCCHDDEESSSDCRYWSTSLDQPSPSSSGTFYTTLTLIDGRAYTHTHRVLPQ